jgi:hypothetical protein
MLPTHQPNSSLSLRTTTKEINPEPTLLLSIKYSPQHTHAAPTINWPTDTVIAVGPHAILCCLRGISLSRISPALVGRGYRSMRGVCRSTVLMPDRLSKSSRGPNWLDLTKRIIHTCLYGRCLCLNANRSPTQLLNWAMSFGA